MLYVVKCKKLLFPLVHLHSLVQCQSLLHLLHTPEGRDLLFELSLEKKIVSRNALPIIPSEMTLLATARHLTVYLFLKHLEITLIKVVS